MSVAITVTKLGWRQNQDGTPVGVALLKATGLTGGSASTIAHGLGSAPKGVAYVPLVATGGVETSDPDATNLYWTTGSNQTAIKALIFY